jgi:hypothetical protein
MRWVVTAAIISSTAVSTSRFFLSKNASEVVKWDAWLFLKLANVKDLSVGISTKIESAMSFKFFRTLNKQLKYQKEENRDAKKDSGLLWLLDLCPVDFIFRCHFLRNLSVWSKTYSWVQNCDDEGGGTKYLVRRVHSKPEHWNGA